MGNKEIDQLLSDANVHLDKLHKIVKDAFHYCRPAGSDHYDEPKPAGRKRQDEKRKRLSYQS